MTKLNHERPNLKLANNFKKISSLATDQNSNIVSHSADYSSLPGEYKGLNVSSERMADLITSYVRSDLARHKLQNAKSGAVVGKKVKHAASRYDFNLAELSREFRPLLAQILIETTEDCIKSDGATAWLAHLLKFLENRRYIKLSSEAGEHLCDFTLKQAMDDAGATS